MTRDELVEGLQELIADAQDRTETYNQLVKTAQELHAAERRIVALTTDSSVRFSETDPFLELKIRISEQALATSVSPSIVVAYTLAEAKDKIVAALRERSRVTEGK